VAELRRQLEKIAADLIVDISLEPPPMNPTEARMLNRR
jgi:hypothetical protein